MGELIPLTPSMAWLVLLAAGVFECAFTTCLKLSDGLTRPGWVVAFLVLSVISFGLLTLAVQRIPLGTAYAVWTGIGALGTATIGIIWFRDPVSWERLLFLGGLIVCIIGLKWVSPD